MNPIDNFFIIEHNFIEMLGRAVPEVGETESAAAWKELCISVLSIMINLNRNQDDVHQYC
jgi:hypothetical protein